MNMESHHILSASTVLDPRLKKIAFADSGVAEACVRRLTSEMASNHESTVSAETFGLCENISPSTSQDSWFMAHV